MDEDQNRLKSGSGKPDTAGDSADSADSASGAEGSAMDADDFEFIKEIIKDRPLDRKKLLTRAGWLVGAGVVFGVISAFVFMWTVSALSPREPDRRKVSLVEESSGEEIISENRENSRQETASDGDVSSGTEGSGGIVDVNGDDGSGEEDGTGDDDSGEAAGSGDGGHENGSGNGSDNGPDGSDLSFPMDPDELAAMMALSSNESISSDDISAHGYGPEGSGETGNEGAGGGSSISSDGSGWEDEDDESHRRTIVNLTQRVSLSKNDYKDFYRSLRSFAMEESSCIVTVEGISSDMDWFDNTYEDTDATSGVIVANNGRELLILADSTNLSDAESIRVTFGNGEVASGEVRLSDSNTLLEIIAVLMEDLDEETLEYYTEATLGTSSTRFIQGVPVMALGSPLGESGSVAYGFIISNSAQISMVDRNIHLINTDIYGSTAASGVLMDFDGRVLGIITRNTAPDKENLLTAYSISDMRETIENMSNGKRESRLGIYGTDVTEYARDELGVPVGAYVTGIEMESPAMEAGIQSGDVITKIGTREITGFSDYQKAIAASQPGDNSLVTLMRYAHGGYAEINLDVTFDAANG